MKKIIQKLLVLSICLVAFVYTVKADEFSDAVAAITGQTVKVDISDSDLDFAQYEISSQVGDMFEELTNSMSYVVVKSCNETSCIFEFNYYNEAESQYESVDGTVPIFLYGLSFIKDTFTVSVGQEITIQYKNIDKNGNTVDTQVDEVYVSGDNEDQVVINGMKVKVLEGGIYNIWVSFINGVDENGNPRYRNKQVIILCNVQNIINNKLQNLTTFKSDLSDYGDYYTNMEATERNLVNYVFPNLYSYDKKETHTACASDDNCTDNIKYNFDFTITVGGQDYTFKKNNVTINEVGFSADGYYDAIDLGANGTHQVQYTLYSKSATWTSNNPSVATVDQEGLITAVDDGAALIVVDYGGDENKYISVRVRTSKDTVAKRVQAIMNDIRSHNSKINVDALSTIDEMYLYDYIYMSAYSLIEDYDDYDNINLDLDVSDDMKSVTLKLGYEFSWDFGEDGWKGVSYCKIPTSPDALWEPDGLDCGVSATFNVEFADEKPGYDASLVEEAEALLEGIDYKKTYPSYLNTSFAEYLDFTSDDEKWNAFHKTFIAHANLNNLIPNNHGLTLELDTRAGAIEYGAVEAMGFAVIYKDDVVYAVGNGSLKVKQVMQVANPSSNTDSAKIQAIKDATKAALGNIDATVTVTKDTEKADVYVIKVVTTSGVAEGMGNNSSASGVTTKTGTGSKEIELKTYVEFVDQVPSVDNPVEINSINVTGIVEPKEGEAPKTTGINVTTSGLSVNEVNWYEDVATWMEDGPATSFVAGKRYFVRIGFNVAEGYTLADEIGEDHITANVKYGKAEYVPTPDVRIYYEAKAKDVPKITTAPSVKVSNAENNTVLVMWKAVENATSYEVLRSTDKKKWSTVGVTEEVSFVNSGLTYGKTYYYKVKAINSVSNKTSSVVSGKAKPNKVENLKITSASTKKAKLAWDSVSVTGYEVYMGTKTSNMKKVKTITKNSTVTYSKSGLKANTTYYFKVRAYKTVSGKKVYGAFSDNVKVKTAPATPTISVSTKDYKSINVKLKSVKGATKYVLEMSTDKAIYTVLEELPASGTFAASDLELGKTYYFRVKVCNSSDYCSSYSKVASKKVVPATPTVSLSTPMTKAILVNVKNQEGTYAFEIYRSTKKSSGYKLVATITGEEELLEFLDTTKKGKTYYYKVRSAALTGEKAVYSAYSSVKSKKSK